MSAPLNAAELAARLKGEISGCFLFSGEETYLRIYYLNQIRKKLFGDEDDPFNHIMLDAADGGLDMLADSLASPPSFAPQKLVEVASFDPSALTEGELNSLLELFDRTNGEADTLLVLISPPGALDFSAKSPGKREKALASHLTVVNFAKETPAKLASWCARHFASRKIAVSPQLCAQLVARVGRDMTALASEIEKLCAYLAFEGRDTLTEEDIPFVTCENIESDPFDFSNAILEGNTERALALLAEMKLRRDAPEMILSGISRVYCDLVLVRTLADDGMNKAELAKALRMHEYKAGLYLTAAKRTTPKRLRAALSCCHDTDIKLKSSGIDGYMLLDRLAVTAAMLRG